MTTYGITEVYVKHDYYSELRVKLIRIVNNQTYLYNDEGDYLSEVSLYDTKQKLYPLHDRFLSFQIENIEEYFYIYESGDYSQFRYKYIKHVGSSRSSKSWSIEEHVIRRSECWVFFF